MFAAALALAASCGQARKEAAEPAPPSAQAVPSVPAAPAATPAPAAKASAIPAGALEAKLAEGPSRSAVPEVGGEIVEPAVRLEGASFLVAYRHAHHAYVETYGYDTDVIRFWDAVDGRSLRGARIAQRKIDGEYDVDRMEFVRSEGAVSVKSDRSSLGWSECSLASSGVDVVVTSKDFTVAYSAPAGKGLRIERRHGDRVVVEEWTRDGVAIADTALDGDAKGLFSAEWPRPSRYLERPEANPEGDDDTEFRFFDVEGGVKLSSEAAEPLSECLVAGLERIRSDGLSLEDIALIELALGEERRITPFLARAFLSRR